MLESLAPEKFGKLQIVKDPLVTKNIPKYTQSDVFRDFVNNKDEDEALDTSFDEEFISSLKKASSDIQGITNLVSLS